MADSEKKLRVSVDTNKCVGSRICVMFLPKVFRINPEGQSEVYDQGDSTEAELVDLAEQCPQTAIVIEDASTGEKIFPPPELELGGV